MKRVLHLTAHLGGGVGKALSGLAREAARSGSPFRHTFVTLERQEKPHFLDLIVRGGGEVAVCPAPERLEQLVADADLVQLEWWNHPATLKALCGAPLPPMRLIVWSHVSGLHNPVIPLGLMRAARRMLFTSPCSWQAREVQRLTAEERERTGVVSSSGGFDGFPLPLKGGDELQAGYIGSLNFAKLHPDYVSYLAAVMLPRFTVKLIGDETNRDVLERQCLRAGRPGMLDFRGYRNDVPAELAQINVLPYLLNPRHYGTTENALIEAMAAGIVPVVLDNPCEREIVADGITGLVVSSPEEFAAAMQRLSDNPEERRRLGEAAARSVRERFTVEKMAADLEAHYQAVLSTEKREVSFTGIFGSDPADWFLSCQRDPALFSPDGNVALEPGSFSSYGLLEETKGTAVHFQRHFPENPRLSRWADGVGAYREGRSSNA